MKLFSPLLMLSLVANLLHAQDTVQLTIEQAEQRFVSKSLDLLAKKYDIDIAKSIIKDARQWNNPNINYSQGLYDPQSKKYFDNTPTGQVDVQVSQLFSIAGKHSRQIKLAKIGAQISTLEFEDLIRSLKFELYNNLSDLDANQQRLSMYQQGEKNLVKLIHSAETQQRLGSIAGNEVVRLRTELQDLRNQVINIYQEIYDLQKETNILLGYPHNTSVIFQGTSYTKSNLLPLQQVLDTALSKRSDYLISGKQLEFEKQNLQLQRSLAVPDLNLSTEYDQASSYVRNYYGIGLSMELPVFNRNRAQIKISKYKIQQVQALDSLKLNMVKNEVAAAYFSILRISNELDSISPKYYTDLEGLMEFALSNYNKHYISLLEFLDQMRTYNSAKLGLIDIQSDFSKTKYNLNYTTGTTIIK